MQRPLKITFREMKLSGAIEDRIRTRVAELERVCDQITGCRVTVEAPHRRRHKGTLYAVRIDLDVPGKELVVDREHRYDPAHEDLYVALRDAFDAAGRQLEDYARVRRGNVKHRPISGPTS